MRKLILAVVLGLTVNANADSNIMYDYNPDPRDAWRFTSDQVWDANTYYIDENGYTQPYDAPIGYTSWTDIDENVYDYEVKIRIK
ncbi:MAG: hypothetical protein GY707_05490 [Desulfobacteraceae bacterium]|nr:hypothetical protein [Desulfobacteraceae bacterium]